MAKYHMDYFQDGPPRTPFCGAGETFSLPMMLLPELTPRAFIEHTRLNELWRTSTSVKVAADLCTS
jgi:hypothetical protein